MFSGMLYFCYIFMYFYIYPFSLYINDRKSTRIIVLWMQMNCKFCVKRGLWLPTHVSWSNLLCPKSTAGSGHSFAHEYSLRVPNCLTAIGQSYNVGANGKPTCDVMTYIRHSSWAWSSFSKRGIDSNVGKLVLLTHKHVQSLTSFDTILAI